MGCRDSDSTVSANRPFRFPFFDALYQRVKISADGYLSFADGSLPYPNTDPIPLTLPPNNILAPYWTNINIGMCGGLGAGGVWTLAQGADGRFQWDEDSTFVIEWKGVYSSVDCSRATEADVLRFQVILSPQGGITFQYASLPTPPDAAAHAETTPTVGVENEDGTVGWQYGRGWVGQSVVTSLGRIRELSAETAITLRMCDAYQAPLTAANEAWVYPCVEHASCDNTRGSFECTCEEGYTAGGDRCLPSPCRVGQTIANSDRTGANTCRGNTGDVCEYECSGDFLPFGEHKCGTDGAFHGGICINECHTLSLNGDCFPGYNGLYIIQQDTMGGQPHFVKQDMEPGDKDLHWSGFSWDIGGLHGRCQQDCLAPRSSSASQVERMFGTHTWQLWCGNGWVPMHVTVQCMQLCADTCATARNGVCEDGGAHSDGRESCYYGTDCEDCGARDTAPGAPCLEDEDEHGFTCAAYVTAGYTCLEMTQHFHKDCSCTW